jgi:hypothetical protein
MFLLNPVLICEVIGTVVAWGVLLTNYTMRHCFVLDGHHKLAAVAKWNATHEQKVFNP